MCVGANDPSTERACVNCSFFPVVGHGAATEPNLSAIHVRVLNIVPISGAWI